MNDIVVTALPRWIEPRELFEEFSEKPHCVWLDTATPATESNRFSILAADPFKIFRSKGRAIEIIAPDGAVRLEGDPFDALNAEVGLHRTDAAGDCSFPVGAAIGYFGYGLKNFVERLPATAADDLGLPDCWFGFYDNLLVFDHAAKRLRDIQSNPKSHPKISSFVCNTCNKGTIDSTGAVSNFSRADYCAAVARAKHYIAAGDIYQVNLGQRFQCDVDSSAPELYAALRESNPAPYCAYLDIGEAQILSSSPECFLKIRDRHVLTRPIKGTRPRGKTTEEDRRLAAELLASPKDNAELVMITDLERNDLGRVCQFGSVWVKELVRVEQYATVFHLVSTIEGLLRREVSHVDCVRACFPGGSITGAPKIRAMQIIDELEPHARGVYTGAIGFIGFNGVTQLNVAIRTVVQLGARLTFHAGSGIVADSDPDAEYEETLAKAKGIFNAIDQLRIRQRPVCA